MKNYEYKHIVGFEETNLVGNVYYTNFVRWQGRCREMFLREKASDVLEMFKNGSAMVTTRVSCEYLNELNAFDELTIVMKLGEIKQNRVAMLLNTGAAKNWSHAASRKLPVCSAWAIRLLRRSYRSV